MSSIYIPTKQLTSLQEKTRKFNLDKLEKRGFRDIGASGYHLFTKDLDKFSSLNVHIFVGEHSYFKWNWNTKVKDDIIIDKELSEIVIALQVILKEIIIVKDWALLSERNN